jgi:hypothetical protein
MTDFTYPHVNFAAINAIRESGTKDDACDYAQRLWNETCFQAEQIAILQMQRRVALRCASDLAAAAKPLRNQIAVWLDGAPPATPDESRALFTALDAALQPFEQNGTAQ